MDRDGFREHIRDNVNSLPRTTPPSPQARKEGSLRGTSLPRPPPPTPTPQKLEPEEALPEFKSAGNISDERIQLPDLIVDQLLHRGCKLAIGGGSKSFKSWTLMDLGLSVAMGGFWWDMKCNQGSILYLNFELIEGFFEKRLLAICRARGIAPPPNFMYWSLRSKCYDLSILEKVLETRARAMNRIDLIIIDPMYKALGDLDENSAGDMAKLMNQVERIADRIGAAVAFGTHFSKGNQAAKESMDRMSGSGVFGRDPDAILTMTNHKADMAYTVDSTLRYLPAVPPFVVRWNFPTMTVDESLDPKDLSVAGRSVNSGPSGLELTPEQLLECLPYEGLRAEFWRQKAEMLHGTTIRNFAKLKGQLIFEGRVIKRQHAYYRVKVQLR